MKNGVVLITYADSFGGDLKTLHSSLDMYFPGCISGIHILPFFPSSGDRGFSPIRYDEIDSTFGTWKDLSELGDDYDIIADFMVNHISRQSVYFRDWLENEDESDYRDLFIPLEKVFGKTGPTSEETEKIYRRKPADPWLTVKFPSGSERKIWCTFSEEQIDIDITGTTGMKLFRETLERLGKAGTKTLRLDAVGYITKKRGSSCFMVEPEIWEILEKLKSAASDYDMDLLPEMHEHYSIQLKMAAKGYKVYDFALPLLVLYAWYGRDFSPLKHWFGICPREQYTTLDTHDGTGVVDAADLLTPEQIDYTIDKLYSMGSNIKRKYSSSEYKNLDIYQINCTFFSALGENDDAYIMARAIQFFAPGIPQIYYVGMLAGRNDLELVERTKNGRDINRHNYTPAEIAGEIDRPVVSRLKKLMQFRLDCPAFEGDFSLSETGNDRELRLKWVNNNDYAELVADLDAGTCLIETETAGNKKIFPL